MTGGELARLLDEGAVTLVDVRTPEEFSGETGYPCDPRQGHIEGAVNIPLEVLMVDIEAAPLRSGHLAPDRRLLHSGQRSEMAAGLLRAAGHDATNYVGSWHEWSQREA